MDENNIFLISSKMLQDANSKIKTIDIHGKEYAEVHERLKAFKSIFPDYAIITSIEKMDADSVTMRAAIEDPTGRVIATGWAHEAKNTGNINKTSHVENCETSAVGRALGNFGIGIKSAFASANEIVNTIKDEIETLEKAQADPDARIETKHVNALMKHCAMDGVSLKEICVFEGIKNIDEMTLPKYMALTNKWTETVNKIKAERNAET